MQTATTIAVWLALLSSACIPAALQPRTSYEANPQVLRSNGFVIFQDSSGALSYHAPVGRDVRKLVSSHRVRGRACQHGFQLPIAPLLAAATNSPLASAATVSVSWADGGYRDAMEDARRGLPPNAVLYDVRADLSTMMILSIYTQRCVVLDAAVALPVAEPAPTSGAETPPTAAPQLAPEPQPAPEPEPEPAQPSSL